MPVLNCEIFAWFQVAKFSPLFSIYILLSLKDCTDWFTKLGNNCLLLFKSMKPLAWANHLFFSKKRGSWWVYVVYSLPMLKLYLTFSTGSTNIKMPSSFLFLVGTAQGVKTWIILPKLGRFGGTISKIWKPPTSSWRISYHHLLPTLTSLLT